VKAGVVRGKRFISYEDVPDPIVGEGEFLVEVAACGICGSDLHSYADGWAKDGDIMGHEYSGKVAAVGPGVTTRAVGDRIALIPLVTCGGCEQCLAQRHNLCEAPRGGRTGGYAELVSLPDDVVTFPVPDGMSMEEAAFLEPLSVAVRAVNRAALDPADPVVVVGCGSIGLSVLQVLKARGVGQVVAVDLSPGRLETARALGADLVLDPREVDVVAEVRARFGAARHRMYEFSRVRTVFECSGAVPVVGQAVTELVGAGGTVVMVALFEQPVSFDANPLVRKEVSLVGSYAYARADWEEAFRLLADKEVDVLATVSHRRPLSDIDNVFAHQIEARDAVKVLLIPG
jgi:2-desacetyl-2-hydroxyethyl bacteriochlorophyllide A dehydrogenase